MNKPNFKAIQEVLLTDRQKQELQKLADELMIDATSVVNDYKETPSEVSGSTIQIHEDSPYLYDWIEGDKWKRVLTRIPPAIDKKNVDKKKKK